MVSMNVFGGIDGGGKKRPAHNRFSGRRIGRPLNRNVTTFQP